MSPRRATDPQRWPGTTTTFRNRTRCHRSWRGMACDQSRQSPARSPTRQPAEKRALLRQFLSHHSREAGTSMAHIGLYILIGGSAIVRRAFANLWYVGLSGSTADSGSDGRSSMKLSESSRSIRTSGTTATTRVCVFPPLGVLARLDFGGACGSGCGAGYELADDADVSRQWCLGIYSPRRRWWEQNGTAGSETDAASIAELILKARRNRHRGVPTLYTNLREAFEEQGRGSGTLKRMPSQDRPAPRMIEGFERLDVSVNHVWGYGNSPTRDISRSLSGGRQALQGASRKKTCKGPAVRRRSENRRRVRNEGGGLWGPRDGKSAGRDYVRGPLDHQRHYRDDRPMLQDGWFDSRRR